MSSERAAQDFSKIRYRKNYLTEVIARIDFLSPIEEIGERLDPRISRKAKEFFPIGEPRDIIAKELFMSPTETRTKVRSLKEWVFHGKERKKQFVVSSGALIVTYSSYNTYEDFKQSFLAVVNTCFDVFQGLQGKRFGLRYINSIGLPNGSPLSWEEFLNHKMLGLFEFAPESHLLSRIFHILEYNYGDYNLRYQFGLPNPDFPAVIKQRLFVLDLDAYSEGVLEQEDIAASIDKFHAKIQSLFEFSITDRLRKQMEIINE